MLFYSVELDAIALYMSEYSWTRRSVSLSVSSGFIYSEHGDYFTLTFDKKMVATEFVLWFPCTENRGGLYSFTDKAVDFPQCFECTSNGGVFSSRVDNIPPWLPEHQAVSFIWSHPGIRNISFIVEKSSEPGFTLNSFCSLEPCEILRVAQAVNAD